MEMANGQRLIVAVTEHRHIGYMFTPFMVETQKSGYSISLMVRIKDMNSIDYVFSEAEKEIVWLTSKCTDIKLKARYSRNAAGNDFFPNLPSGLLSGTIIPYVQKNMYQVALLLMNSNIPVFEKKAKYSNLYDEDRVIIFPEFASAQFSFTRSNSGTLYSLRVFAGDMEHTLINRKTMLIVNDPCVMIVRDKMLVFNDLDAKKLSPFLLREVIQIPQSIEQKYYRNFVLNMVRDHTVEASGFEIINDTAVPKATLSIERTLDNHPALILRFRYADNEFLFNDSRKKVVRLIITGNVFTFRQTERDFLWESKIVEFLNGKQLKEKSGAFTLPNLDVLEFDNAIYAIVRWISENADLLKEMGIEIRQESMGVKYFTGKEQLIFELKKTSDWFDLYAIVIFGEFKIPFIKLKKYILNNIREFELPNGELVVLPEEWFVSYKQIMHFAKSDGSRMLFQKHHFNLLRHQLGGISPQIINQLTDSFNTSETATVPANLQAVLRNYQLKGFHWMLSLFENGLGGCLADDMGLGKTLQTLTLLLKLKKLRKLNVFETVHKNDGQLSLFGAPSGNENMQPASLIVLPTSLMHNWFNEIEKFSPSLKVYRHQGNQRNKSGGFMKILANYDLVLTTYGTLRNDIELLRNFEFFYIVLDESQYIKNPESKTYQAIMEIKAQHRLVLTGTPIENSLSDLWAQMNFLNKGLLGSFSYFKKNFLVPVENQNEENVGEKLQLLVRPFILRRTKSEVAGDLPPLMEQVHYCTMSAGQESEYEREKSVIRNAILATIDSRGINKSSVIMLQGLTRLRQLANHPRLLDKNSITESGKFDEIFMLLGNLIAEGHKVLIFSSFVTHLALVREKIESLTWKFSLLTGKTQNREVVIRNFQSDPEIRIFLISLKAGGVGLNLTGADYVFILDPWWNPAAENQAVSRAHRIGQEKHVFVYKFITENSIEEKIQRLKERKSALADKFINSNDPFKQITADEIAELFG